jgi:uroporphyrinogen-III synthase
MTVGHSTARQARQAGFAIVESADGDARALAALVLDRVDPAAGSLLLVSGRGQGITLAAALRSAGHRVIRRVTYTAIPATQLPEPAAALLRAGEAHVALFFSAETARTYVRLVRRAQLSDHVKTCEAVAIGGPAGVALEGLPWRRIRVAARPNQDEMFALLQ